MYVFPNGYYHYREPVAEGFDKVRFGYKWGVTVERTEFLVVPVRWKGVKYLSNTLWGVTRDGTMWGIFSTTEQELIIRTRCDEFYYYSDTHIGIRQGNNWFLFHTSTKNLTNYFGAPL